MVDEEVVELIESMVPFGYNAARWLRWSSSLFEDATSTHHEYSMQDFFLHFCRRESVIADVATEVLAGSFGCCGVATVESKSPYSAQLYVEDRSCSGFAILYGSLWNAADLAARFQTDNQGAMLWRGWQDRGSAILESLRGPVAGAVYDRRDGRLWAFRDRMGMSPVFFYQQDGEIAVTSDPGLLLQNVDDRFPPNRRRLAAALNLSQDAARDYYFEKIERLRPREVVQWDLSDLQRDFDRYWTPESANRSADVPAARRLRAQLSETTAAIPQADRWHAVSGGLDSSTLLALDSKEHVGEEMSLTTGSLTAEDYPESDETKWITRLHEYFPRAQNHPYDISEHGPLSDVGTYSMRPEWGPEFVIDECWWRPFLRFMSSKTGARAVVLGFGGDRLFSVGREELLRSALQSPFSRSFLSRASAALAGSGPIGALRVMYQTLPDAIRSETLRGVWQELNGTREARPWLEPANWLRFPSGWDGVSESDADSFSEVNLFSNVHLRLHRNEAWRLEKVYLSLQRRSRRSGVKFICPLLDGALWELCAGIEMDLNRNARFNKCVLRNAMSGELPQEILEAPNHTNYSPILADAVGRRYTDRASKLLENSRLASLGLLNVDKFEMSYREFCRAVRGGALSGLNEFPLWQVFAAELWLREL